MPDIRDPLAVIVTGVGGGGFGEQILKALRLAETRYEIVGTDVTPLSKGFAAVDHRYVVPPAADPRYMQAMLAVCGRHHVKVLFAGSEPELRVLANHRSEFESEGVFLPLNPVEVIDTCLDKDRTMQFLASRGFSVPRTIRIEDESRLHEVDVFPVVIKPSQGGGGSADVYIAQDRDELVAFTRLLLSGGRTVIVQEYVGSPDDEYTVGILTSMSGELINSIALRRFTRSALGCRLKTPNRTGRRELGDLLLISSGISQGEISAFPDITGPCEQIAAALGSRGPLNIQCRYVDGRIVVFEINPRFSGTTSLRAMVGYNEPDLLVREHVLGKPSVRRFAYRSGVILRGLDEVLIPSQPVPRAVDL